MPPYFYPLDDLRSEIKRLVPGQSYGMSYDEISRCFGGRGWEDAQIRHGLRDLARSHNCRLRDTPSRGLLRFRKVLPSAGNRWLQTNRPFHKLRARVAK